ncbi:hypothetical protein TNIN_340531 [Trichonephila inaurata madagascariensis]|uniref:Uncharacterized protein n=1 Tax=Trichonephila inaurata madagascariensis TaxID=2747483 RepID=A0A8X6XBE9_9ARAC|nr:hypothetical protein TNIN_340531 [Trichonephila inaurata madagascariensis]
MVSIPNILQKLRAKKSMTIRDDDHDDDDRGAHGDGGHDAHGDGGHDAHDDDGRDVHDDDGHDAHDDDDGALAPWRVHQVYTGERRS